MMYFSKTSFLSVALIGSLMMGVSAPAIASGKDILKSQGKWVVSKMGGNADISSYCAMARKFDKNIILTMAENKEGEISFAVDFQAPALRKTKDYTVTLSSGAGENRTFSVLPVSNKAFVVRLGRDDAFASSMKASNELVFGIDGKYYGFETGDINSVFSDMDKCISALGGVASEAVIDNPSSDIRAEKIRDNNSENQIRISSLLREIDDLKAENKRLIDNLSKIRVDLEKSKNLKSKSSERDLKKIEVLEDELASLKAENASLLEQSSDVQALMGAQQQLQIALKRVNEEKEMLSASLAKANEQISFMKNNPENIRKKAQLETKVKELELELETALANEKKRELEYNDSKSKIAKENEKLLTDIASLKENLKKVEDKYTLLNKEYEGLKLANSTEKESKSKEIAAVTNKLNELKNEKMALEQKQKELLAENKKEIDNLKMSLDKVIKEKEGLERKVTSLENELKETTLSFDKSSRENISLFDDLNSKLVELEKKDVEKKSYIEKLEAEKTELQNKISSLKESGDKDDVIASLEKTIEGLKKENETLLKKIKENEEALLPIEDVSEDVNADKLAKLEEEIKSLRAENSSLNADLSIATAKVEALENSESVKLDKGEEVKLRKQIRSLKNELELSRAEVADLKEKLEKTVITYENKMLQRVDSDDELQSTLRRLQEAEREIRRMANRMERQKQEYEKEKKELEYMLFDPELASAAQVSFLNSLEDMLENANQEIENQKLVIAEKDRLIKSLEANQSERIKTSQTTKTEKLNNDNKKEIAFVEKSEVIEEVLLPEKGDIIKKEDKGMNKPSLAEESSKDSEKIDNVEVLSPASILSSAPAPIPTPVYKFMEKGEIENILAKSDINISGGQITLNSGDGDRVSYSWDYNGIYGKAEQQVMDKETGFGDYIKSYIGNIKDKCPGDFAAVANQLEITNRKVESYELACVSNNINSAVSVLFMEKDGVFIVISHEAASDRMIDAMDARDRIIANL